MRGVILDGELFGPGGGGDTVHVLVELEDGVLHARRAYGARAAILSFELDAVEAALGALKAEAMRQSRAGLEAAAQPQPGDDDPDLGPLP